MPLFSKEQSLFSLSIYYTDGTMQKEYSFLSRRNNRPVTIVRFLQGVCKKLRNNGKVMRCALLYNNPVQANGFNKSFIAKYVPDNCGGWQLDNSYNGQAKPKAGMIFDKAKSLYVVKVYFVEGGKLNRFSFIDQDERSKAVSQMRLVNNTEKECKDMNKMITCAMLYNNPVEANNYNSSMIKKYAQDMAGNWIERAS